MHQRSLALLAAVSLALPAHGADKDDAALAAREIIAALSSQKYELIYDKLAAKPITSKVSRDDFIAQVNIARSNLGGLGTSKLVETTEKEAEPEAGYQGTLWLVDFNNAYDGARLNERLVIVKDPDGKFRLAGLWGNPVPPTSNR